MAKRAIRALEPVRPPRWRTLSDTGPREHLSAIIRRHGVFPGRGFTLRANYLANPVADLDIGVMLFAESADRRKARAGSVAVVGAEDSRSTRALA